MDGCWNPGILGCVIDWNAWAAIATFLAVFAALSISWYERRERERVERSESRVIGKRVSDEMTGVLSRLSAFVCVAVEKERIAMRDRRREMEKDGERGPDEDIKNDDLLFSSIAQSSRLVSELDEYFTPLKLPELQRALGRLYVLPSIQIDAIFDAENAIGDLRQRVDWWSRLSGAARNEDEGPSNGELEHEAGELVASIRCAEIALQNVERTCAGTTRANRAR